jgi:hypothetical protein
MFIKVLGIDLGKSSLYVIDAITLTGWTPPIWA